MPLSELAARIRQFNQGRRPEVLAQKYAKLRKSAWSFFRGTGHLFYAAAALPAELAAAPLAGLCGDLHLENFGVYAGDNGQACFSVNDFDDALLGPLSWDLARLAASLFVGLASLGRPAAEAASLAADFLTTYDHDMAAGGPALPDAAVLAGPIGRMVRAFPERAAPLSGDDAADLLASGQHFNLARKHFGPVTPAERAQVTAWLADFAGQQPGGEVRPVLDVARLAAGTSSLGLERYAVLLDGQGADRLLELKEAIGSCAAPYQNARQPDWPSQARRVVAAQRLFQAVPPAQLGAVGDAAHSFVVRAYARTHQRISLDDPGLTEPALTTTVRSLARVVAAGHLRGSTAPGAGGPAALPAFAAESGWQIPLIDFAWARAQQSQADYKEYCAAYDRGELGAG